MLCSNNESYPIIIDPEETLFWVRKIRHLETDDTHFLDRLKEEIPAFLYFLQNRPLSTMEESRLWFKPSDIHTEALDKIIAATRDRTEVDMAETLLDIMTSEGLSEISFCTVDLKAIMEYNGLHLDNSKVRRVLRDYWHIPHTLNSSYVTYSVNFNCPGHYERVSRKGRFYTVTKEFLETIC